jgi:hypothetical protein
MTAMALAAAAGTSACLAVDLTNRPCPCLDGFVCVNDVCVEEATLLACPATFSAADSCAATPPASARLAAVCEAGAFDVGAQDEIGTALGTCFGPPASMTIASHDVTGSLAFSDGVVDLGVSGTITWDVAIPASCKPVSQCLPSEGSGSCTDAGDDCACTDVVVPQTTADRLDFEGGRLVGNDDNWLGCFRDGRYLLRRDDGTALGALFIFLPE